MRSVRLHRASCVTLSSCLTPNYLRYFVDSGYSKSKVAQSSPGSQIMCYPGAITFDCLILITASAGVVEWSYLLHEACQRLKEESLFVLWAVCHFSCLYAVTHSVWMVNLPSNLVTVSPSAQNTRLRAVVLTLTIFSYEWGEPMPVNAGSDVHSAITTLSDWDTW